MLVILSGVNIIKFFSSPVIIFSFTENEICQFDRIKHHRFLYSGDYIRRNSHGMLKSFPIIIIITLYERALNTHQNEFQKFLRLH